MQNSLRLFLTAVSIWVTGCQDKFPADGVGPGYGNLLGNENQEVNSDSSGFTQTVDLTVDGQVYRNVDVIGTIYFRITPAADSVLLRCMACPNPYYVFISTEMRFRRSGGQATGQNWSAGEKSGDIMMLDEGTITPLTKSYRIMSISNEAYINIIYGVTLTSVDVRVLWVTYAPLPP